ncbi:MAG TPA: hypothetical protein VG537_10195, partial [Candidatus Kapabacteria bacterium]|jgi:hypothetical protein|nr:hypothetical protein [Candidatus Kapabacteria bacterium]
MQLGDANVTLVNTSGVVQTTRGFTLSGSAAPISLTGSTPVTGNSGDVLTSAGAGATPTWTSTSGFTANAVSLAPASSTRNVILPTGDFTALTLQAGSATPSADIFDIQSHSASDLVAVGATGNVGIGQAPGTHQLDVTGTASIAITPVISDAALRILNSGSGATSQDGEIITTNGAATIAETGLEIIQTDNGGGTGSHTGIKFTVQNGASNTDILGTSSNWKVTSAGAATFGGGATVTGATNVNSTGSATTTIGNYNSTTPASSTVTNLAGTNVYSYAPSGGASAYTVPQGATVVEIADDGTATGVAVTLPAGTNGQVLYIHNADAQAETSIGIPIGATWTMIYSGGAWHHAN